MKSEKTRDRRAIALAACGCLLVLATIASCSTPPDSSSSPPTAPPGSTVSGGDLRFGLATDPGAPNPVGARWSVGQLQVARALYDPLVSYDENYVPKPLLAESVRPNDNFTVWTITLREGVRFHDGSVLDAEAVRAQLEAARVSPELRSSLSLLSSVEAKGDRVVEVRSTTPWSTFLHILATQVGYVAKQGSDHPIGSGPFAWDSAQAGERVRLRRAGTYWQKDQPVLEAVEFEVVGDPAVRLREVRSGDLDVAEIHEPDVEARLTQLGASNGPVQVLTDNSGETPELVIVLHTAKPPFSEPPARQAVAFGVDRDAVSRRIFGGAYPQAYGPYSEGSPWYGQAPWPGWDAGKSRQSALDYQRDSGRPLRFTMLFPADPAYAALGQLLVSEFEAAGIDLTLDVRSSDEIRQLVEKGDFEAAVMTLFAGGHPEEDLGLLYSKSVPAPGQPVANLARFRDPITDEAIDKSRAAGDISKQADQYQKVQEQLAREAPYIFLIHVQGSLVAGKDVQGLTKWTLPDGSPGISQLRTTVALNDAWVTRPG